jgi:hypothetical protein
VLEVVNGDRRSESCSREISEHWSRAARGRESLNELAVLGPVNVLKVKFTSPE